MRTKDEWLVLLENFKNNLVSPEFIIGEIDRENDYYEDELTKFRMVLKGANEICRTTSQIVDRRGEETNWSGFEKQIDKSLLEQHKLMYPESYDQDGNNKYQKTKVNDIQKAIKSIL